MRNHNATRSDLRCLRDLLDQGVGIATRLANRGDCTPAEHGTIEVIKTAITLQAKLVDDLLRAGWGQ